jgi:hypothetical protein
MSISGSRGIIRVSKNVACELQAAMALEGVKEPDFYQAVTGKPFPGEYGERFAARRRGTKFERNLHANNAALLRKSVSGLFGLNPDDMWVRNFEDEVPGPPKTMRAQRLVRTREIMKDLAAGRDVPHLVIQPQFTIPSRGPKPDFFCGPDFMVLDPVAQVYVPGEEKSFITRENVAEPADKDLTRRQAAAQVIGLRAVLDKVAPELKARVLDRAVFVFATPYGLRPAPAFIEKIEAPVHEVDRALTVLGEVQRRLKELRAATPTRLHVLADEPATANRPVGMPTPLHVLVDELATNFQEGCLGSCIMADVCEKRHAGTARVLGDYAADLLGREVSLAHIADLLAGRVVPVGVELEIVKTLNDVAPVIGLDEAELARRMSA